MNAYGSDLAGVVEPDEFPRLSAVGRLVHAAARRDVTTHIIRPGAQINYLRVRVCHSDASSRAERHLAVRGRSPGCPGIRCAKQAATGYAHVERLWLRGNASDGRDASTARRS